MEENNNIQETINNNQEPSPRIQRKTRLLWIIAILAVFLVLFFIISFHTTKTPPGNSQYSVKNNSPLTYDQAGVDRINDLTKYRFALNSSDEKIKSILIKQHNPLLKTDNYIISYNSVSDKFQVQVATIEINTAKDDAVSWFKKQGFSDDAICHLPIEFTIDEKDAESLRGLDIVFNPLPTECQ
jgi:hypothetical protein